MPVYDIWIADDGYDFRKQDDNIKSARAWAEKAFQKRQITVTRADKYRFCGDCQCAPCCCMVRHDV